jgi:hypothetical protein
MAVVSVGLLAAPVVDMVPDVTEPVAVSVVAVDLDVEELVVLDVVDLVVVVALVGLTEVPVSVTDVTLCVVIVTVTIFISGAVTTSEPSSTSSPCDSKAVCKANAKPLGSALMFVTVWNNSPAACSDATISKSTSHDDVTESRRPDESEEPETTTVNWSSSRLCVAMR